MSRRKTRRTPQVPDGVVLKVTDSFPSRHLAQQRLIEARQERVAYLMLLGWTAIKIADEVGVNPSTISYDIKEIRAKWQQQTVDAVAQAAITDVARLDFIIIGLLPLAISDVRAADACLKAIHQKATILGYNTGVSVDVEEYIRDLAVQNGASPDRAMEIATRISLTMTSKKVI